MSSLASLRQRLAEIIPPLPAGKAIPTGLAALDAALSDGGLPCGRLTEIVGTRGSGKTTLVRALVAHALEEQRWVAYIDATRTLAPADWVALAATGRLWMVRPPLATAGEADHGAWCADVLLRSGAFGMVVLDGGGTIAHGVVARLTHLARESNAVLLVVRDEEDGEHGGRRDSRTMVGGAVRIRVRRRQGTSLSGAHVHAAHDNDGAYTHDEERPERWRARPTRILRADAGHNRPLLQAPSEKPTPWMQASDVAPVPWHGKPGKAIEPSLRTTFTLSLSVEKGGTHHAVEVCGAIDVARRLCSHSPIPDRRGVAPRNRRGERIVPDAPHVRCAAVPPVADGGKEASPGNATLAHKRRCAEPRIHADGFLVPSSGRDGTSGNVR